MKKVNIFKNSSQESAIAKSTWRETLGLITGYFFKSNEKRFAWLSLIGIILCVVGLVGLGAALAWCSPGMIAAMVAKTWVPFLWSMGEFFVLLGAFVGLNIFKNYLIGNLSDIGADFWTKKRNF